MPGPDRHTRPVPGGRAVWFTEQLWELTRDLPVQSRRIADIPELDQNCWFGPYHGPTCREVAVHAKKIWEADLAYPIILSPDGGLMDGGHRLSKAWLNGLTEIRVVQFTVDPEPDHIIPDPINTAADSGPA